MSPKNKKNDVSLKTVQRRLIIVAALLCVLTLASVLLLLKNVLFTRIFAGVMLVADSAALIYLVLLISRLGIKPLLRANECIKEERKIPESGTAEFRSLAGAYNRMFDLYENGTERLQFKAYHDELTGVYNRAGYESIVTGIDLKSTYMLLFDIDALSEINSEHGRETGDEVLKKLVRVLKKNFRPDDSICRVDGDEFVVFMLSFPQKRDDLVAAKLERINSELSDTSDGLPSVSISVGIVHGSEAGELDDLFKKTDLAMYQSKQKGESAYTFL
ncbi:MAG: diguanylate cyclase [Eubacterium sp.]|nr:diguanylate cyclase [Eubacterium sp.]MBR0412682.1 diguanylate cyclase [Eubacterium sp.]